MRAALPRVYRNAATGIALPAPACVAGIDAAALRGMRQAIALAAFLLLALFAVLLATPA